MCLTIPAKVLSIEEGDSLIRQITVEDSRGQRPLKVFIEDDLDVGDWVLYTSGAAVQKVSEEDAREIIELLEPKSHIDTSKLDDQFVSILSGFSEREPSKEEIVHLLKTDDATEMEALFSEANTLRQANLKDFFCIHGIIEFSNHCVRDCHYCGLRKSSSEVNRYRMTPSEIVETAVEAVKERGYKLIVLQSGDDFSYTDEMLVRMIRDIKEQCNVFIFMSVGERSIKSYKKMKDAGASGVLFRFETSNRKIYDSIHPGQSLERRIELLKGMKELGYYIASGFLIGLPEQTVEDIADDILFMKSMGINMVTVGPFVPSGATPLSSHPAGDPMMTLKVTAVSRLLIRKAKIPVTTSLETIEKDEGRRMGLSSGANSLMFNLTPEKYRDDYHIYPNKYHGKEEMWEKYGLSQEKLSYKMLEKNMLVSLEETQ